MIEFQKLQLLKNFRRELDGFVQLSEDREGVVSVLKRVLEEGAGKVLPVTSELKGRVEMLVLMLREADVLGSTRTDMRRMIGLRIKAAESAYPKVEFYMVRSEETEGFQEIAKGCPSKALELIPSEERTLPVRRALIGLFQKSSNERALLKEMEKISDFQRSRVVERTFAFVQANSSLWKAVPFFLRRTKDPTLEEIVTLVGMIPESARDALIIQNFMELFRYTRCERGVVFEVLAAIARDQVVDTIEQTLFFIRGGVFGYAGADVIRLISTIPQEERAEVVGSVVSLCRNVVSEEERAEVLGSVIGIPRELRADVIEQSLFFLPEISRSVDSDVIRFIASIPPDERTEAIRIACSLCRNITLREERKEVLEVLMEMPRNLRSDVGEKVGLFFKKVECCLACILSTVYKIPREERLEVMLATKSLMDDIDSGYVANDILLAVKDLPKELRNELIEAAAPFSQWERAYILRILSLFSEKDRVTVLTFFKNNLCFYWSEFSCLFDYYPELKSVSCNYLMKELEAAASGSKKVRELLDRFEILYKAGGLEGENFLRCLEASAFYDITFLPEVDRSELFFRYDSEVRRRRPAVFWMSNPENVLAEMKRGEAVTSEPFYLKMLEKYKERDSVFIVQWLGYCEAGRALLNMAPLAETKVWERLFTQIAKIRPSDLRNFLSRLAVRVLIVPRMRKIFESERFETLFSKEHMQPFRLFASMMFGEDVAESVAAVLRHDRYKDVSGKRIVLNAFTALLNTSLLTPEDKNRCLRMIFSQDEKRGESSLVSDVGRSLFLMESIGNLGSFDKLKEMNRPEDLESILEALFVEVTGFTHADDFFDRYVSIFGSGRKKESLFIYAGKLRMLSLRERGRAMGALKQYTEEVLNGTFPSSRYDESSSVHLATVFAGRPELKRVWTEGKNRKFEEISVLKQESFRKEGGDLKRYLSERIEYVGKSCSADFSKEESDLLRLQQGLLSLVDASDEKRYEVFKAEVKPLVEKIFSKEDRFGRDLLDLEVALNVSKKNDSFSGWSIEDTDDPQDLLLSGTEVLGSCQSIYGDCDKNKCLLGYLLDGKNRLIAVKNETGEIMARVIVRLLWDEEEKRPVLFKERVYAKPHLDQRIFDALHQMSGERAEALGVPLVVQESADASQPYPRPLSSLGSRSPFEYTDAGGGVTNGRFTVSGFFNHEM